MGRFYKLFPCKIYTDEVPQNFVVPSMYFPPPFTFDGNDSISTFLKTFTLSVKLFHKDAHAANDEAERIADAVRAKRMLIPIINQNGMPIGEYIRADRIETRIGDGFASIIITWTSRYFYEREVWPSVQNIVSKSNLKE